MKTQELPFIISINDRCCDYILIYLAFVGQLHENFDDTGVCSISLLHWSYVWIIVVLCHLGKSKMILDVPREVEYFNIGCRYI